MPASLVNKYLVSPCLDVLSLLNWSVGIENYLHTTQSTARAGLLDTEGRNEDVDNHYDKDESCGHILQDVQSVVISFII